LHCITKVDFIRYREVLSLYGEDNYDTFDEATVINNSAVTDKLDCGCAVQEALFAVRREEYPRYELRRFKILVTLMMEVIYSSETSVPSTVTRYKVP
jgi:hypothetical protein